jgi:cytochrome c oxidase subunit I+III
MIPPRTEVAPAESPLPGLLTEHELAELHESWKPKPGVWGWLTNVDHKSVAARFIVTAFVFFLLGGVDALLMRTQLARPENRFLGPDLYNQLFSVHGTTMIFLFAVPIMEALGLYFVPLMIGTRNVAFPRLNLFGYYCFLFGGVLLYVGLFTNTGPDTGWFSYVPLAGPQYSPGKRVDVWGWTVTFTEIAALVSAVEIIVTVFKQRAPGMSLNRMPIFVWAMLITAFTVLFAMTTVATATLFLAMDRVVGIGTHFFNPAEGGDALLWQHLFWFFGHPEVYIIFIPATGMVSTLVAAFTRREVFGYPAIVLSMLATAIIGYGVWVHHMFATPVPELGKSFYTAASVLITIPSGIQIFCWIATLWAGRPRLQTPLLYVLGFIFLFMIGGITGVMISSVPFDLQVHDTFFIVAHFHYVLLGGSVFPLFGALYYWFPKVTGRLLSETLGKWQFGLFFVALNVTFFPMHFLGFMGMPRRVYTYLEELGWGDLNLLATVGAFTIALSVLLFLLNAARALRRGPAAGENPWGAAELEWATHSPPPPYNFAHIPVVEGRYALWKRSPDAPVVTGLRTDTCEVLLTTTLDAEPESRHEQPGPSIWPLAAALAVAAFFIVSIFTPWGAVIGGALLFPALLLWGWPRGKPEHEKASSRAETEVPG